MPEKFVSYFDQKYLELKQDAKTYGDLKKIIKRVADDEGYSDVFWGNLLRSQLMSRLSAEMDCLSINC